MSSAVATPSWSNVEGFVADHGVDAAGDEAGSFFDYDTSLRMRLPTSTTAARVSASVQGRTRFRAASLVHGIEKVHADAFLAR